MTVDLFLTLLITSTIVTMALTESVKRLLLATDTPYRDNVVVWFCTMIACTGVGVAYRVPFGLGFSFTQLTRLCVLMMFTWVLSMHVYDKVVQTVAQHKRYKECKYGKH